MPLETKGLKPLAGYRVSVLNRDDIAKVNRTNGPVVLAADHDAMPKDEVTVSYMSTRLKRENEQ